MIARGGFVPYRLSKNRLFVFKYMQIMCVHRDPYFSEQESLTVFIFSNTNRTFLYKNLF